MKNYRISLLLAALFSLNAGWTQSIPPVCGNPLTPGADFCDFACVNCLFDGYVGTNGVGPQTNQILCSQITLHNPSWLAFVAGASQIDLQVTSFNCSTGDGLQFAVLNDCNGDLLGCHPGYAGSGGFPLQLITDQYIPGKTYFMVVDGFAGDVCDFEVKAVTGSLAPPVPGLPTKPQGPQLACSNQISVYSISPVIGAGYYHWTAPPGSRINGLTNDEYIDALTGTSVEIEFGTIGGQVCVSVRNACSNEGPKVCLQVDALAPILTALPPISIGFVDLPYTWPIDNTIQLVSPGVYHLAYNHVSAAGCDSLIQQEVTVLPPGPGYLTGFVFIDANNNGVRDAGELPYTGGAVLSSTSGEFASVDAAGHFEFLAQNPGDTIRISAPIAGFTVQPSALVVQNGQWHSYDFGLVPISSGYDLRVSLSSTVVRPGFDSWVTIACQNVSQTTVNNVELEFNIPPFLEYQSASIMPDAFIGNKFFWQLGTMQPGAQQIITVQVYTPFSVQIGNIVVFSAKLTPDSNDLVPADNVALISETVVGSYDPNDKKVSPAYVTPGMLQNGLPFVYHIRFQNTGTYKADFVKIIDTLDSKVDPGSFKLLASSHPCTWEMRGAGVVEFFFKDINLPDSSSN